MYPPYPPPCYVYRPVKPYTIFTFVWDVWWICVTGGLWLIWIFCREMRKRRW